jgi:hypothetical protein
MDSHHFGKLDLDPNPHQIGKPDPDPHQIEKQDADPDPRQSGKVIFLHWRVLEKVSGSEWYRIRIHMKLKCRIRIRIALDQSKGRFRIRIRINVMRIRNTAVRTPFCI